MSAMTRDRDHKITPLFVSTVPSRSTKSAIRHGQTDGWTYEWTAQLKVLK